MHSCHGMDTVLKSTQDWQDWQDWQNWQDRQDWRLKSAGNLVPAAVAGPSTPGAPGVAPRGRGLGRGHDRPGGPQPLACGFDSCPLVGRWRRHDRLDHNPAAHSVSRSQRPPGAPLIEARFRACARGSPPALIRASAGRPPPCCGSVTVRSPRPQSRARRR